MKDEIIIHDEKTGATLIAQQNVVDEIVKHPKVQRAAVLVVARDMVRKHGLINLSRWDLCDRAGIADGSFPHIMGCTFSELVVQLKAENLTQPMTSVSKSRVSASLRKEHILAIAVELAKTTGYINITRDGVAEAAGVSFGLVNKYFGTMTQLKGDVMRAAIKQKIPEIVAQGLASCDERARKAPSALKQEAIQLLLNQ